MHIKSLNANMKQWAEKSLPELVEVAGDAKFLISDLERLQKNRPGAPTLQVIYESLHKYFYTPVNSLLHPFLWKLGDDNDDVEVDFDAKFRLGPGCLQLILSIMDGIYKFLIVPQVKLTEQNSIALLHITNRAADLSQLLLHCLMHMRRKHSRSVWDPAGFRDFYDMYTKHEYLLEVSIISIFRNHANELNYIACQF